MSHGWSKQPSATSLVVLAILVICIDFMDLSANIVSIRIQAFVGGALVVYSFPGFAGVRYGILTLDLGTIVGSALICLSLPLGLGLFFAKAKAVPLTKFYLRIMVFLQGVILFTWVFHLRPRGAPSATRGSLADLLVVSALLAMFSLPICRSNGVTHSSSKGLEN
jgi:hypothetical protein